MIKGGPKIIDDNLVACLDAHDAKSYAGEPTTNLISNGGFENNTTSGWSFDPKTNGSFSVTSDDKKSGLYSAKLTNSTSSAIALWKSISITSGQQYTMSAWIKNVSCPTTPYFSVSSGGTFNGTSSGSSTTGVTAGSDWVYVSKTFTATNTQTTNPYIRTSYSSTQGHFLVDDFQIENKTYSTPFANTTRSATDGWKDRSGNSNDGTLVNGTDTGVSHYRDGEVIMPVSASYLDFDGSDDYIDGPIVAPNIGAFTYEAVIYRTSSDFLAVGNGTALGGGTYMQIFVYDAGMRVNLYAPQGLGGGWKTGNTIPNVSNTFVENNTYHVTVVNDGTVFYFYKNGVSLGSYDHSYLSNTGSTRLGILRNHVQSVGGTGRVYLARMYDEALTAAEVLSNYNATKNRFT